jgi:hypothetical protein
LEKKAKVVIIVKEEGRKKKKERPQLWQQLEKKGFEKRGRQTLRCHERSWREKKG